MRLFRLLSLRIEWRAEKTWRNDCHPLLSFTCYALCECVFHQFIVIILYSQGKIGIDKMPDYLASICSDTGIYLVFAVENLLSTKFVCLLSFLPIKIPQSIDFLIRYTVKQQHQTNSTFETNDNRTCMYMDFEGVEVSKWWWHPFIFPKYWC